MDKWGKKKDRHIKLLIASYVFITFIGYLCIGLPLAVLPIFIHKTLGYSEVVAGVVISLQYLTTFMVRGMAGKLVDTRGPKRAVMISMVSFLVSGAVMFWAFSQKANPALSLSLLIFSRLVTGCAEGMVGASPINWAMLVVGNQHTATAISYNGIASYGALALGAPLGVIINEHVGISWIALSAFLVALAGFLYALPKKAIVGHFKATPISFLKVLGLVAPYGICLGLGGLGFGGLSNFITLYYDYFHWDNAALCLTVFSVLFILGRVFFAHQINILGGLKVSWISLLTETIGLFLLFFAGNPSLALIGAAVTGLGFSLIFPALGVEAVRLAPASSSGAALACYGLFIDISLGLTGPVEGAVIHIFGMKYLFAFCAVMVLIATLVVGRLMKHAKNAS